VITLERVRWTFFFPSTMSISTEPTAQSHDRGNLVAWTDRFEDGCRIWGLEGLSILGLMAMSRKCKKFKLNSFETLPKDASYVQTSCVTNKNCIGRDFAQTFRFFNLNFGFFLLLKSKIAIIHPFPGHVPNRNQPDNHSIRRVYLQKNLGNSQFTKLSPPLGT
jgi:hypothetical protein